MNVKLEPLNSEDENQFITDNQRAFKYGAEQYFTLEEMEEQYEEPGEIISRKTISRSIHNEGAKTYRIILDDKKVGGIIINIKGSKGDLDIFFVLPECHSKGIGQNAWREIEELHPEVKIWETVTPTFEKRNIHFYVNKLGFNIVEYFNEFHKDSLYGMDLDEMYKFRKIIE